MSTTTVKRRARRPGEVKLKTSKTGDLHTGRARTAKPDQRRYSGRFAVRLVALREGQKMTVLELAYVLEVSKFTVYAWENGSNFPSPDLLPAIAKALGCKSVHELMPPK